MLVVCTVQVNAYHANQNINYKLIRVGMQVQPIKFHINLYKADNKDYKLSEMIKFCSNADCRLCSQVQVDHFFV